MINKKHWKSANNSDAYHAATAIALGMREYANMKGYNTKGIKVLSKQDVYYQGHHPVDSMIVWDNGPTDWAFNTDAIVDNVLVEPHDGQSLYFYMI